MGAVVIHYFDNHRSRVKPAKKQARSQPRFGMPSRSAPPSLARSGRNMASCTKSSARAFGATAAATVQARSLPDTSGHANCRFNHDTVNAVLNALPLAGTICQSQTLAVVVGQRQANPAR